MLDDLLKVKAKLETLNSSVTFENFFEFEQDIVSVLKDVQSLRFGKKTPEKVEVLVEVIKLNTDIVNKMCGFRKQLVSEQSSALSEVGKLQNFYK